MNNKIYLNWNEINEMVYNIYNQIKDKYYKFIYGLPRGGLIPAVMLSHLSGLELIVEDKEEFLKRKDGYLIAKFKNHSNIHHIENTIIIDDIYDRGETLKPFLEEGFQCYTLTRKELNHENLYSSRIYNQNDWIVFPWETEKSSKVDYLEK